MNRYTATIKIDPKEAKVAKTDSEKEKKPYVIYCRGLKEVMNTTIEFEVSAVSLRSALQKAYEDTAPTQGIKSVEVKQSGTWPPQ